MKRKLLSGFFLGWIGAIFLAGVLTGFPHDLSGFKRLAFFALAPGAIIGIIITYIVNKPTNSHSSSIKRDNIEERLIKLKTLLDQGILNKEEFEQQKKKILEE